MFNNSFWHLLVGTASHHNIVREEHPTDYRTTNVGWLKCWAALKNSWALKVKLLGGSNVMGQSIIGTTQHYHYYCSSFWLADGVFLTTWHWWWHTSYLSLSGLSKLYTVSEIIHCWHNVLQLPPYSGPHSCSTSIVSLSVGEII